MSTLKETWSRYVTMVWSFIWPKKYVLVWFGEHFQYLWGFFHNFELKYHQFTPIELQRFSQKGYCTFFFFGNLNSYEHITRFYKNTRIYQQKNIISTFLGTGGHFPDFQLTLSQFAPFQFSLARVIVHFIFIKLNLYTHLSQF